MKTILIHSIQDEFSTVAWQRANYREMSHIYECMESSNIPCKTSQIIAPLRGGAETSKQHNETMKRWSDEALTKQRNGKKDKRRETDVVNSGLGPVKCCTLLIKGSDHLCVLLSRGALSTFFCGDYRVTWCVQWTPHATDRLQTLPWTIYANWLAAHSI